MMSQRQVIGPADRPGKAALLRCRGTWLLALALLPLLATAAAADEGAAAAPLRLCADPTNPPFSSNRADQPGFYLELGTAIGQALDRPVEKVWEMTYYGKHATRETLLAGKCDMSIGLPTGAGFMGPRLIFSQPFMQVGFALVLPKGARPTLVALRGKRVAVQLSTPPQNLLAEHGEITTATFLDPESAVQALADGRVDAAFVWGPSAGYMNHTKLHDRFAVAQVAGDGMQWNVGIGFSSKQGALRDQVDHVLTTLGGAVAGLATKYGFPAQAPVSVTMAPIVPFIVPATLTRIVYNGAPPRAAVIRVAATADSNTEQTTDDQKDAADSVAGNATDKDKSFKAAATPTAVADGRTIFNGTCNHCHGPDAVQSVKKIDLRLLHHRYGGAMDQVYHYTVTHGRESKGMPNWSGVFTEDDFSKILAFLHSVQTE